MNLQLIKMTLAVFLMTTTISAPVYASVSPFACRTTPLCTCKKTSEAVCTNVPYIPELPKNTKKVTVEDSNFPNVTRDTFKNLTSLKITFLLIRNNSVLTMAEDAFTDFLYITTLELVYERNLHPRVIRDFLFNVGRRINSFILRGFNWTGHGIEFPDDLFAGLKNSSIQHVVLTHNNMRIFKDTWFTGVDGVRSLDFTLNYLSSGMANYSKVRGLMTLDLKFNTYRFFPNFCRDKVPNLRNLNMMSNKLRDFKRLNSELKCLNKLEFLNLDRNYIQIIYSNTFSSLPSLKALYVCNLFQLFRIEGNAFNSSSLEKLMFCNNGFRFAAISVCANHTFDNLPNLHYLDISGSHFARVSAAFRDMFLPLFNLRRLTMFDMVLSLLPFNFSRLPALEILDVSMNEISNFNGKIFGDNLTIKYLDLTQNRISIVNQTTFPESLLDNLASLNLSRNPLSCSCNDVKWFYNWLQHSGNRKKMANLNLLLCQSPRHLKDRALVNLTMSDICPLSEEVRNLIIGLSVSAGLLLFLTLVLYLSRWHIRYWLFIVRSNNRQGYTRIPNDDDFIYDGFLVYAEEDRVFVHDILLPRLETQEGFRLCVHYRDFEAGKFIADNIVDNMNQSRKVIIVLSNNFAKSRWCDFELMIAQNRLISEQSDLLLLILYKDIDFRYMSAQLRMLLTTMTYVKWSEDREGERLFWRMLNQRLQRTTTSN